MYQGVYHGSKKHEADLSQVLKRAWDAGLSKMIITGTSLSDSKAALELAKTNGENSEAGLELQLLQSCVSGQY